MSNLSCSSNFSSCPKPSNASERTADKLEQCAYAWHTVSGPSRELDYLTHPLADVGDQPRAHYINQYAGANQKGGASYDAPS
jgi:hypothetical protein